MVPISELKLSMSKFSILPCATITVEQKTTADGRKILIIVIDLYVMANVQLLFKQGKYPLALCCCSDECLDLYAYSMLSTVAFSEEIPRILF